MKKHQKKKIYTEPMSIELDPENVGIDIENLLTTGS